MKKNTYPQLILACTIVLHFFAMGNANSQGLITTTISSRGGNNTNGIGRDYWLTMAQNFESQPGKYYELFVVSRSNTIVNISVTGGSTSRYPITAGQTLNFLVPLAWEMTTSGVVEAKGIHVWSNDADLVVDLLSRNPASSDGYTPIPTTGWGKEYVVASYGSLYTGSGGTSFDYPSELCVVASQNNTVINIVPSVDIRTSNGKPDHKAHIPFTEMLNKGECVQYKAVLATDCGIDVTGSVITSNFPVGVVGASQCTNIPCEYRFCDHLCEMIPPIRSWGKTYQTIPFATRQLGDSYLVIGSKPGQNIYRNGSKYASLVARYDFYLRPDIAEASLWTSDAPFMLVQYINSTEWETTQAGGNPNVTGDPSMVVINPVEQYTKHIIFQTPSLTSNGFSNYANVIVNRDEISKTIFDGKPIASMKGTTQFQIPNSNYTAFRIAFINPGKHEVVSDSGMGVYIYGYGSNDAYSWNGNLGIAALNTSDTIPPSASVTGGCFTTHILIKDDRTNDSKVNSIVTDTLYNMSFTIDSNFITGSGADSSFYDLQILDSTKEAYATVSAYDIAGNRITTLSTYKPKFVKFSSVVLSFGTIDVGASDFLYDTICNVGALTYHFIASSILLTQGSKGFAIDSIGADGDIAVGSCRVIKIKFTPTSPKTVMDTVRILDECFVIINPLIGNGGQPDFALSDENFKCHPIGTTTKLSDVTITDLSKASITFDSVYIDDAMHFGFDGIAPLTNQLPFTLQGNASRKIEFSFKPDSVRNFQTLAHFHSLEIGWKTAVLIGCGTAAVSVSPNEYASSLSKGSAEYISVSSQLDHGNELVLLPVAPNPLTQSARAVRFVYGLKMDSPLDLSVYDILGNLIATVIHTEHQDVGIYESELPISANISAGSYIYRLSGAGNVLSGKLVVTK